MEKTIEAYRRVTASEEFKELERLRIKASHDEAQALFTAEKRGAEIERKKWQKIADENERLIIEIEQLRKMDKT